MGRADEVHVWCINLKEASTQRQLLWDLLASDERERAMRFRFQPDRDRFTVTRGCLRILLSHYVGSAPAALQFCYGTYGKPALQSTTEKKLSFNVSHSHDWALIAVGQGQPVGIDLEQVQPDYPWDTVLDHVLSPHEQAILQELPMTARCSAFFKIWTCKEAFVKATGNGLSTPLTQFSVLDKRGTAQVALIFEGNAEPSREWAVHSLSLIPGYSAAVATIGERVAIRCWRWTDALIKFEEVGQ